MATSYSRSDWPAMGSSTLIFKFSFVPAFASMANRRSVKLEIGLPLTCVMVEPLGRLSDANGESLVVAMMTGLSAGGG